MYHNSLLFEHWLQRKYINYLLIVSHDAEKGLLLGVMEGVTLDIMVFPLTLTSVPKSLFYNSPTVL